MKIKEKCGMCGGAEWEYAWASHVDGDRYFLCTKCAVHVTVAHDLVFPETCLYPKQSFATWFATTAYSLELV